MFSSRAAIRTTRAVRVHTPAVRRNVRFASDSAGGGGSAGSSHLATGALAGAGAATVIVLAFYQFSGIRPAVQTATQAKSYFDSTTGQLKAQFKEATPDNPNEVIQALRETANKYAKWLPGGTQYVDKAFEDLETVRKKHGSEVDSIVREAYGELRDASKKGMSLEALSEGWEILQKHLHRLSGLAADAGSEIINNHPQLKNQFGGSFDQLKQLGDKLGPDAKKQVDETWSQVSEILGHGFRMDTVDRIRKLVQEKTEQVKKLGEQAWQKGYEQLQPMLEKNPQIKKLVEQNMDVFKQGNISEAVNKVQSAISSGSTQDLEQYINQSVASSAFPLFRSLTQSYRAKDKAQDYASGDLSKWLNVIPNGSKILPQLQKYKEVAEKHGEEAEGVIKDTFNEILQVLEKRSGDVEKLYKSAQDESKK